MDDATLFDELSTTFRASFERAPIGLAHLSVDGRFLCANDELCRILGHTREELQAIGLRDIVAREDLGSCDRLIADLAAGRATTAAADIRHIRKNGEANWANVRLTLIHGDNAGPDHVVAVIDDIHKRKHDESLLRELRGEMQELLQLNVAAQTASAIAHEINQPLNAISSYAEAALRMLRAGNPDQGKLDHALEGTVHQSQRAAHVVRELMEFLQKGETEIEEVNLNHAVENALAIVESDGFGGFHSHLDLDPKLRPARANRIQVEKVLVNLMRNSVEAMRGAGVMTKSIRIVIRTDEEGNMAKVSVTDCGPGFDADTAKRLFQPFFTTKPRGIGMGLAISRTLIEAHGGQLWLDMQGGPGATFHFTLPIAQ